MSRKENALDLAKFVDKGVRVKLSGGREGVRNIQTEVAATEAAGNQANERSCVQFKGR